MASFTKKVLGLAGAATMFAGMAFGQATCVADPTAPTATNIIRAEGTQEQVAAIQIRCTNNTLAGTAAGPGSLQVFLSPSLPVTSKVINATTGTTEAVAIISGDVTQYLAQISGSTLNFSSLPLPALAPAASFTIRVSNVRVNATSLSVGTGVPPSVSETAFISGPTGSVTPAVIASQQVSFVQNGLAAATVAGVTNFVNCVPQTGTVAATYTINENFPNAFKAAGEEANQVAVAGQATAISTRIKLSFANVPTGVSIALPLTVTAPTGVPAVITWVTSDTGTTAAAPDVALGLTRTVALTAGAGSVTYSVTTSDPSSLDRFAIPILVTTTTNSVTTNTPAFTVTSSFAPVGATTNPNFVVGSAATTNLSTFSQCSTSLLFPFVSNQLGFDTGLAISNTSSDPFGATRGAPQQAGTCTLNFYGTGAPSPANVTTPNVATGTVYTTVLSSVAAGFQGYIVAQCNFQFAHGFAFITNGVGANGGLSQGYLAGVIPDTNQVNRRANPLSSAAAGTGETLGN